MAKTAQNRAPRAAPWGHRCPAMLGFLLVSVLWHSPPVLASSNVTLKSITIFQKHNWFFSPSIYFSCVDGNRTELTFVKEVLHWYPAEANAAWQPLLQLEPRQCRECGVYQHLWLSDSVFGRWNVCTHDFSPGDSEALLSLVVNGSVAVDLSCPECAAADAAGTVTGDAAPVSRVPLGIFFWVFVTAVSLGISMSIVSLVVYAIKGTDHVTEEERSQLVHQETSSVEIVELGSMPEEKHHPSDPLKDDPEAYI